MIKGGINALKFFFLSTLFLGCGIALFLSTDFGKEVLIEQALKRVNSSKIGIKIAEIEGYFPLKVKFSQIEIMDHKEPQLFLRDVKLSLDLNRLITDKVVQGEIDVAECILFDTPPSQEDDFAPLQLDYGLDLQLSCGNVLIEERGPNYFLTARMPNAKIQYNPGVDQLAYKAQLQLDFSGQPMSLDVSGQGKLNDFVLNYSVTGDGFAFNDFHITKLNGDGKIEYLPWKGQGPINIEFKNNGTDGKVTAQLNQDRHLFQVEDIDVATKGLSVHGSVFYNSKLIDISGDLKLEINRPEMIALPISGQLSASTQFDFKNGDADIKAKGYAKTLKQGINAIESFELDVDIKNLLKHPTGQIQIKANQVSGDIGEYETIYCDGLLKDGMGSLTVQANGPTTKGMLQVDLDYQKELKKFSFKKAEGVIKGVPFELLSPCQLSLTNQTFSLDSAEIKLMNSPLKISGVMKDKNLKAKIVGQMDMLAFSKLYLSESDVATGMVDINLNVNGPIQNLNMDGDLEEKNGTYENLTQGTAFKDIRLKLKAEKDVIRIIHAQGQDAKGAFVNATGSFNLSKLYFDIQIKGQNLRVLGNDQMALTARDAEMNLTGYPWDATISGTIQADEASYSIAQQVKSSWHMLNVVNMKRRGKLDICQTTPSSGTPAFNPALRFSIEFPPVLKINGRGLTSTWKGRLDFKGTFEDPKIEGKLDVDSGLMNFLGQTLTIEKGVIRFDGSGVVPYIDTMGVLTKQDIEVNIGLVGWVNKPMIDLQSKPALPKDEIISILFFGKDKSKLSAIEAVQLARALAAYKGIGSDIDFFGIITDNLGLEHLTIGSGTVEGSYTLKVSKRLGDRMRVNLNQGTNAEDSTVELEVDITKNISIKGEHGFAGSKDGVSVNYNWDY